MWETWSLAKWDNIFESIVAVDNFGAKCSIDFTVNSRSCGLESEKPPATAGNNCWSTSAGFKLPMYESKFCVNTVSDNAAHTTINELATAWCAACGRCTWNTSPPPALFSRRIRLTASAPPLWSALPTNSYFDRVKKKQQHRFNKLFVSCIVLFVSVIYQFDVPANSSECNISGNNFFEN